MFFMEVCLKSIFSLKAIKHCYTEIIKLPRVLYFNWQNYSIIQTDIGKCLLRSTSCSSGFCLLLFRRI